MKMPNRKGQLTIFIIIGIVLLFSTALIIYIRNQITPLDQTVSIALEDVPTEAQPVQNYIVDCLKQTLKQGLIAAGSQGGYIDTSGININEQDPTSGEGISLFTGSETKIPYWIYMSTSNTCAECSFESKQLMLNRRIGQDSLESQLDKYVQDNLPVCLANFEAFENQLSVEEGELKVKTTIAKAKAFVQMDCPINLRFKNGVQQKMSKFGAQIDVSLGKMYDLANEITRKEASNNFLGFFAVNLIDVYGGINKEKLPPLADTTLLSSEPAVTWIASEVKDKVERRLEIYVEGMQVAGTNNFEREIYKGNSDMARGIYYFFTLPMNRTYQSDVNFRYSKNWPIYMKITPSSGELISPDSATILNPFLSFLGIKQYKFAYDVSYPVLVTLNDPTGLDGGPFTFNFAIEANIRNNVPLLENSVQLSSAGNVASTMVCNPDNFNSPGAKITVTDSMTNIPVENVLVYYSFGSESCLLGQTEMKNGKAVLETKMPVGIGTLILTKDDYSSKSIPFATTRQQQQKVDVLLDSYVDLKVKIFKVPVVKSCRTTIAECSWLPGQALEGLDYMEQSTITFTKLKQNSAEDDYIAAVNFDSDSTIQETRLTPGKYEISGTLIDNKLTIISAEEICYPDDWYDSLGFGKDRCETIPATEFEQFAKGGVQINSFEITPENLKNSKTMEIYIFSTPDGYTRNNEGVTNLLHEDLGQMGKVEEYSSTYYDLIKPRFE